MSRGAPKVGGCWPLRLGLTGDLKAGMRSPPEAPSDGKGSTAQCAMTQPRCWSSLLDYTVAHGTGQICERAVRMGLHTYDAEALLFLNVGQIVSCAH